MAEKYTVSGAVGKVQAPDVIAESKKSMAKMLFDLSTRIYDERRIYGSKQSYSAHMCCGDTLYVNWDFLNEDGKALSIIAYRNLRGWGTKKKHLEEAGVDMRKCGMKKYQPAIFTAPLWSDDGRLSGKGYAVEDDVANMLKELYEESLWIDTSKILVDITKGIQHFEIDIVLPGVHTGIVSAYSVDGELYAQFPYKEPVWIPFCESNCIKRIRKVVF